MVEGNRDRRTVGETDRVLQYLGSFRLLMKWRDNSIAGYRSWTFTAKPICGHYQTILIINRIVSFTPAHNDTPTSSAVTSSTNRPHFLRFTILFHLRHMKFSIYSPVKRHQTSMHSHDKRHAHLPTSAFRWQYAEVQQLLLTSECGSTQSHPTMNGRQAVETKVAHCSAACRWLNSVRMPTFFISAPQHLYRRW